VPKAPSAFDRHSSSWGKQPQGFSLQRATKEEEEEEEEEAEEGTVKNAAVVRE
jgi:hypothetical protein